MTLHCVQKSICFRLQRSETKLLLHLLEACKKAPLKKALEISRRTCRVQGLDVEGLQGVLHGGGGGGGGMQDFRKSMKMSSFVVLGESSVWGCFPGLGWPTSLHAVPH